jgi:hypothetical protein
LTGSMTPQKAGLCRLRQPIGNEVRTNLTIFFRCFLNTPEGMDADLGFSGTSQKRVGFDRNEPQIGVHVEVSCQAHYEKAHEKDSQIRFLRSG